MWLEKDIWQLLLILNDLFLVHNSFSFCSVCDKTLAEASRLFWVFFSVGNKLQASHVAILEWTGSSYDIALECAL